MSVAAPAHPAVADLVRVGAGFRERAAGDDVWPPEDLGRCGTAGVDLDEQLCRAVADRHERAPRLALDHGLAARYERTKHELRSLFADVVAAGFVVRPWLGRGQPYRSSDELTTSVRATRTIHVLPTRTAHGPAGSSGYHPLREPSDVEAAGVPLAWNDLLRAVHDLFGHVMLGCSFGPVGELRAAYCQMALHSPEVRTVLFTEQVAQTCWFYFGPHVRADDGSVPGPGDGAYVPPSARPYPEQKVYAADPGDVAAFRRMFAFEAA